MRTTNRCDRMLLAVLVCVAVAGCAAFRNTLAQDQALERWQMCQGKAPDVTLKEVRPDGQSWFFYLAKAHECLREAAVTQRQRATTPGANVSVVQPPAPAAIPAISGAGGATSSAAEAHAPVWKIGDEWAYRYNGPLDAGTYVWSVVRTAVMDGFDCYVIKTGDREIFYRKEDLASVRELVSGVVIRRDVPPRPGYQWPLLMGKTWEQSFTRENWRDKQTTSMTHSWEVVAIEDVTVPAGTFKTIKIVSRNARTSRPAYEVWYAPDVKQWVKIHEWLESGERTREMTEYKLR